MSNDQAKSCNLLWVNLGAAPSSLKPCFEGSKKPGFFPLGAGTFLHKYNLFVVANPKALFKIFINGWPLIFKNASDPANAATGIPKIITSQSWKKTYMMKITAPPPKI